MRAGGRDEFNRTDLLLLAPREREGAEIDVEEEVGWWWLRGMGTSRGMDEVSAQVEEEELDEEDGFGPAESGGFG